MPWISISPSSHQLHPLLSHEELLSLFQVAASCLGSPTVSLKTGPSILPSSNPEQVILPSDSYFFQKLLLFFCFIVFIVFYPWNTQGIALAHCHSAIVPKSSIIFILLGCSNPMLYLFQLFLPPPESSIPRQSVCEGRGVSLPGS